MCRNLNAFYFYHSFFRYLFRTANNIGPSSMPTCTDYESAVKQFMETNKKRQAKIDRNLKALANFGEEEMKRMLEQSASEDDDEKAEEMNEEVIKQENISYVALVFEDVAFISR